MDLDDRGHVHLPLARGVGLSQLLGGSPPRTPPTSPPATAAGSCVDLPEPSSDPPRIGPQEAARLGWFPVQALSRSQAHTASSWPAATRAARVGPEPYAGSPSTCTGSGSPASRATPTGPSGGVAGDQITGGDQPGLGLDREVGLEAVAVLADGPCAHMPRFGVDRGHHPVFGTPRAAGFDVLTGDQRQQRHRLLGLVIEPGDRLRVRFANASGTSADTSASRASGSSQGTYRLAGPAVITPGHGVRSPTRRPIAIRLADGATSRLINGVPCVRAVGLSLSHPRRLCPRWVRH